MDRELLKRRLIEQEEYAKNIISEKIIAREKQELYQKYLDTNLIKAIIGPRRAGKTTLGFILLKNKSFFYINFDDEVLSRLKSEELGVLLEMLTELFGKRKYLLLDEIQNIDGWEMFVNRLQRKKQQIIVTGSNSKLLSKEFSSHLGGRVFNIELLPFSFNEYLRALHLDKILETDEGIGLIKKRLTEYIFKGGFPEAIFLEDDIRKKYYQELFNTIIFKDITQRFKIRHTTEFMTIANIILNQFSARSSLRNIAKETGISIHTVHKYLDYLEEAYFILSSKKFSYKPKERELSFKKYYCIDTGLLQSKRTAIMQDFGRLIENIVAAELERREETLYYYMTKNNQEVDFVIFNEKVEKIIQVVYDDDNIPKREIRSGLQACKELKCKNLEIITWNKEQTAKDKGVTIRHMPLWKWLTKNK